VTSPSDRPPEVDAEVKPKAEHVDLDSLEPHASPSPENKSHFKALKESARQYRDQVKSIEAKLAPVATELGIDLTGGIETALDGLTEKVRSLKTAPSLDPATQAELDSYRQLSKGINQPKLRVARQCFFCGYHKRHILPHSKL
jgi:hypothetical protein